MRLDFWNRTPEPPAAICEVCNRTMHTGSSCLPIPINDGVGRITHGNEAEWQQHGVKPGERCNDCGVEIGGVHHPGCDQEICSLHRTQLLWCGCLNSEV